jgi:hypothetical protein
MPSTAAKRTKSPPQVSPETLGLVRANVRDLLLKTPAFRELTPEQQAQIAHDTVEVCSYLAEPEGMKGNRLAGANGSSTPSRDPYAFPLAQTITATSGTQPPQFRAQAAREGAAVAGALLQAVNFPDFVSGLIKGVFHAIVQSSIEQMEAYGRLVADVAKTLNQFRDENVTENQGRDHLVEQFPDVFKIDVDTGEDGDAQPRVTVRDGVDEDAALKRVNDSLPMDGGGLSSLDDDELQQKAVPAARTQLATSRQQLLATMVLMGINRIVVTDGRISAKVMYDFQARDNMKYKQSATRFDYDPTLTKTATDSSYDSSYTAGDTDPSSGQQRNGSWYAKGTYKTTQEPVLNLVSATQMAGDAELKTKASLAGQVEVNFKSDYLPLEKMADSFQIAKIQDAAKPGTKAASGAAPATTAPAPATTPAPAPAAVPAK